jgi:transcriptional regulator with PAS, ATPase and Fis domain
LFPVADNVPQWIGVSAASRAVEEEINRVARSDVKVLITGESGVGKEVVARLIHHRSQRGRSSGRSVDGFGRPLQLQAALVTVFCAGVTDSLLESELFGHVKGSFTGAVRDNPGLLRQTDGGTVFLDEVGEMSLRMQALLLRFLETGEIHQIGAVARSHVNVRVIAATNRNLWEMIAKRTFREDLFYRLNVIAIEIPPLRQRREDIPVLLDLFLRQLSESDGVTMPRVDEEAAAQLVAADWPGNVRQLRNVAERLVALRAGLITTADLLALT